MRRWHFLLCISASLTACDGLRSDEPSELDGLERSAAGADAARYLSPGSTIIAICGPSKGVGLYLDSYEEGYSPDAIDDGVIVFARGPDGRPEIVHRDALKQTVVMSEEGGEVSVLPASSDPRLGVWVVRFPTSGVVETHNLALGEAGQLLDLWTSNKPADTIKARSLAFHSKCEFQS